MSRWGAPTRWNTCRRQRHYRYDQLRSAASGGDRQLRLFLHRRANDDGNRQLLASSWPPDLSARLLLPAPTAEVSSESRLPPARVPRLIALISAIGMSIFLQNYVSLILLPAATWRYPACLTASDCGQQRKLFRVHHQFHGSGYLDSHLSGYVVTIFIRYSRMGLRLPRLRGVIQNACSLLGY